MKVKAAVLREYGAPPHMTESVESMAREGIATTPEDIAITIAFLVSDVVKKLSGQVIEVFAPAGSSRGGAG